ncbi:MAG TPA: hypothetical protein VF844_07425 [Ktedonobacteraceae bacterium]
MNSTDLPPIPRAGEYGPQVCDTVRLYLAVLDDLSPEQVNLLFKHISICSACAGEFQLFNSATRLVAGLATTTPSPRVDAAIMAMQSAQHGKRSRKPVHLIPSGGRSSWLVGQIAVAAVLLLALLTATHFISLAPSVSKAFVLPANLSWSNYVLYHSETRIGANGMHYRIDSYHDLGSNRMHIETTASSQLDVVVVGDDHAMLGKDMLHRVAQWGADAWAVDDSLFDLAALRHELQAKSAVYLDKESFKGQEVYRIRCKDGLVMLLDMDYMPVNVLQGATGSSAGEPMYDSLKMMPTSEMPSTIWDMSIPAGFQMGTLPAKP